MPTDEEIRDQLEQIQGYRRNVQIFLLRASIYGGKALAPPDTQYGLSEAYKHIARCKDTLRRWGIPVEDKADDSPHSEDNKGENHQKRLDYFLLVSKDILEYTNSVTLENQKILSPFLIDANFRSEVTKNLQLLFHNQENRGDFAKWETFLQSQINKEDNDIIKHLLQSTLDTVILLRETIYSPKKQYITKGFLLIQFQQSSELDTKLLQEAIEEYFDKLRSIEERVGRIVGDLQSLLSS